MIKDNFKQIKMVLLIILFANIGVAIAKIILGAIIKSTSMTADGFHSLTDGSSNIVGLIGIWIASKPCDKDHPYGHRKFETLAGLFIVAMLLYLGLKIIVTSISKFLTPVTPHITLESLIVMLITLAINMFVSKYEYKKGTELNSTILISDSMHTKSDIYVTIGVIITMIVIRLGVPPIIDPIASIVVAGFILHAAYEIFIVTSRVLVDSSIIDVQSVESIVMQYAEVKGVHKIRSRGTVEDMHIDMHVLADSSLTLEASHQFVHEIEKAIRKKLNNNAEVIIHLEPYKENLSH
jgi:cation diffusion facilitator family transporter